jgi:hypothetical protein
LIKSVYIYFCILIFNHKLIHIFIQIIELDVICKISNRYIRNKFIYIRYIYKLMSLYTPYLSPSYITPNFITCSDSCTPIIPSSAAILRPIGATVVIPGPVLPLPSNFDLNKDPRVHKQVTKYFRYKTLDRWLYDDMVDLLGYFRVDENGVHLINNLGEYKEDIAERDDEQTKERKINYIEKYILTENTMHRILKKLVKGTGINWYDLHKNEFFVKEAIKLALKNILKETISEHSKSNKQI